MDGRVYVSALLLTVALLAPGVAAQTQDDCLEGTLWEPYTEVCADVRDLRDEFMPPPAQSLGDQQASKFSEESEGLPVPGGLAVGIIYGEDQLVALNSGRLHTKMFVQPDGLQADGELPAPLYTTATSRVNRGLEILISYAQKNVDGGRLWLYAWPIPDNPWQWFRELSSLTCNITHGVDQGGHAHKLLYYANHTDKLDDGAPPQWKSAMYLWNYCDDAWDLTWEHVYRADKTDCSVANSRCGWWGPGIETFGDVPYPQIAELGYEDSLLYHDGVWSELRPPETEFRDVRDWAPYQLFHLDPNRSFGAGNWFDVNDPPVIDDQQPLQMLEDESLTIGLDDLVITDADVDQRFHVAFAITLYGGDDYTHNGLQVTPDNDFSGLLRIPVTASDGAAESPTYELQIDVIPVNDAPVITGQNLLATQEATPFTIALQDVNIDDPDNDLADMTISVQDGAGYQRVDNTITPNQGVVGDLQVGVLASDGDLDSDIYVLTVTVRANVEPPKKKKSGGGGTGPLLLALLLLGACISRARKRPA